MLVYLSGGIDGFTPEEIHTWREKAKKLLKCDILDPTRMKWNKQIEREIVEQEKKDINLSDFVLVYYLRPSVGTSMEIMYAWERGLPVFVVNERKQILSSWIIYHATKIFDTLEGACGALNKEI